MIESFLEVFGADEFYNGQTVLRLLLRFIINLVAATIVIRWVYVRYYDWNRMVFTCFAFNVVTFALCIVLSKVPIELGFALGLFAVFGVLRYRTESIRLHDLTYLFIAIGIALLNGMAAKNISFAELIAVNGTIVCATAFLEWRFTSIGTDTLRVSYDKLELLQPGSEDALAEDLTSRTGLPVRKVELVTMNLSRGTAVVLVHHPRSRRTIRPGRTER